MGAKLKKAILAMCVAFGREANPLLLQIYGDQLAHVAEDVAVQAIQRAIAECQFWPPPATVRQYAGGTAKADLEGQAAKAWLRVDDDVRRLGSYRAPDYEDDPAVAQAIALMGGWVELCCSPEAYWELRGRDFRAHYVRLRQSGDMFPVALRGMHDSAEIVGGVNPKLLNQAQARLNDAWDEPKEE